MSAFFDDMARDLTECVAIARGEVPMEEVKGMPAPTFRPAGALQDPPPRAAQGAAAAD